MSVVNSFYDPNGIVLAYLMKFRLSLPYKSKDLHQVKTGIQRLVLIYPSVLVPAEGNQ